MQPWERRKEELKARAHIPEDAPGRRSLITAFVLVLLSAGAFALAYLKGASPPILGTLLLASGVTELIDAAQARRTPHALRIGLAGALPCLLGLFMIFQLGLGAAPNVLAISLFFFASAAFRGGAAGADRYPRWHWDVGYAVIGLALGAVLLTRGQSASLEFAAVLVGVELAARAISVAGRDFAFRRRTLAESGQTPR